MKISGSPPFELPVNATYFDRALTAARPAIAQALAPKSSPVPESNYLSRTERRARARKLERAHRAKNQ